MSTDLGRVLAYVLEHPWAVTPDFLETMTRVLARRLAGRVDAEAILQARELRREERHAPGTGVAVLPLHGLIASRATMLTDISGGTSYDQARADLAAALADTSVGTIVLDIDSPGGCAAGVSEFAHAVMAGRTQKPIIAQVAYTCGSAAYWCASCATEIVASPGSMVGSIGCYMVHENLAKALEAEGVERTYIAAGKYKVEGRETGPLSADAMAFRQSVVDEGYAAFVADVASGRGVPAAAVRSGYGEGRLLSAPMALSAGMIDRVASFDDTLARFTGTTATSRPIAATATVDTPQDPFTGTGQDRRLADRQFLRDLEFTLHRTALTAPQETRS
jgi:signal peptide peptidase SppA